MKVARAAALLGQLLLGTFVCAQQPALELDSFLRYDGPNYDGDAATCDGASTGQFLVVDSEATSWVAGWADWGASASSLLMRYSASGEALGRFTLPGTSSTESPYPGPRAIVAARPGGGVYFSTRVTEGRSTQVAVVAFDGGFRELWRRRLSGTSARGALALAPTATGLFQLAGDDTGLSPLLTRLDPLGSTLWNREWPAGTRLTRLVEAPAGSALVAGDLDQAPFVESWSTDGERQWAWQAAFEEGVSGEISTLTPVDGGWLVAGRYCADTPCSIWLARLDGNGVQAWLSVLEPAAFLWLSPTSVVEVPGGGLLLAGVTRQPGADDHGRLARFTPAGGLEWVVTAPPSAAVLAFGALIPLPDGGALAAGTEDRAEQGSAAMVYRFSGLGTPVWSTELTPPEGRSEGCGLATADDGGVRATTTTWDRQPLLSYPRDLRVTSVSADGALGWSVKEPAAARPNEWLVAAELNRGALRALPDGGMAAVGATHRSSGEAAAPFLVRFERDAELKWSLDLPRPPFSPDQSIELRVDASGNLIVSTTPGDAGSAPIFLTRVSAAGNLGWTWSSPPGTVGADPRAWTLGAEGPVVAYVEAMDPGYRTTLTWLSGAGEILRNGHVASSPTRRIRELEVARSGAVWMIGEEDWNCFVERWTSDGTLAWSARYSDPGGGGSTCSDLALDENEDATVVGEASSRGLVLHYDAAGVLSWRAYSPPGPGQAAALALVELGEQGDVQVGGHVVGPYGTAPLLARFDRDGNELWASAGEAAGPGELRWLLDRSPLGMFALYSREVETKSVLTARLFDRTGTTLSELALSEVDSGELGRVVGHDVTADGRILLARSVRRVSWDLALIRLRGAGELFADDFERGDFGDWERATETLESPGHGVTIASARP